jgi:segregation and condensation protein B
MSISEGGGGTPPGQGPFSEGELAAVTAEPTHDAELDEVDAANIDEPAVAEPAEKGPPRGRRLTPERARTIVESLLLVADRPLSLDQLQQTTGLTREVLTRTLEQIAGHFREGISGIVLQEVAGGWQLRTDPGSTEDVRRFLQIKPQRLTRAALETLAIIAYRQPVTRPDVEDVRGVDSGAVIKALLERKLIRILGRKEEIGRPILYGTSREFLEFFSLRDLGSLPTLREFQELSREHQEIVEREAPAPAEPPSLASLADPGFRDTLASTQGEAEEALAALEDAISTADQRSKQASSTLAPAEPPPAAEGDPGAPKPQGG